ncbi:hypothetical protein [Maribacter polysaccharolyticus]|uniref:hypothetical protein n=1 Tax=Maribacter polysaccharolyticus TaxID=3020831 RepID=UPI00237F6799|nr:hypothetical protein [Maribacter polysaccharolyticus]MDE3741491.1 hypothetical protein [Maribacter polysaccharolyticus]
MKFHPTFPYHYVLLICAILFQFSCAKDSDLFTDFIIEENLEDLTGLELADALLIPSDFDWNDIPEDYENAVWEITESFDLEGASITLPEGVTLYFNGGLLTNGTLTANETLIASQSSSQILDTVSLSGTIENEYIMPYWFGAVMDGITDDRDAFVKTLAYAESLGLKVLVDKDMFLDVEETGTKAIFLEDKTWIEGANEANIIINNLLSPAFFIALSEDVTIKNITFLYDQEYDAAYDWKTTTDNHLNQQQLEDYLTANRNITFSATNPAFAGTTGFHTIFSFEGSQNVLFEDVTFKAKGETANKFTQYVIKFKEQYSSDQTIATEGAGNSTDIPTNIIFNNIVFDGYLMGMQGVVENLTVDNLKAYRCSDFQNEDGSYLGGRVAANDYRFPPPHLFYLNDGVVDGYPNNITLTNIIDYGDWIGTTDVRQELSGYCHSLKLVGQVENVKVDNYKSYRADGLGDWGGITNSVFTNIYAESQIDRFNPTWGFNSLRIVGTLNNVSISNMTIKDNSDELELYPLDVMAGDYVTLDNVHVYVNEIRATSHGPFGISGSNNTILNSSLNIENHNNTDTYKAIIFNNNETLSNGANNHYEIEVNGWREISNDPLGLSMRMLMQYASNSNENYAKVVDTSNNFTIEQESAVKQDTWTRTEEVELGSGSSQLLNINIPRNFYVKSVNLTTLEALEDGLEVYLSTNSSSTNSNYWLTEVSTGTGSISKNFSNTTAHTSNQTLYLVANDDFENQGEISVELVLGHITSGN